MKIDFLAVVFLLNGILIDASCPARCACGYSVNGVDLYCYGRNLEYVPNLPNDTHELFLHSNLIPSIESYTFSNLANLSVVTLAANKISIIKQFAFVNLTGLHHINIAYNLITAIEGYAFVGMPSLHFAKMDQNMLTSIRSHTFEKTDIRDGIDLSLNNISFIEANAFGNISSVLLLNLTSNPINCDCSVYPLWSWIVERKYMNAEATCSNGTFITSLGSSELEKCNPDNCQCLNDGKCVMTGGGKVMCDCSAHWTGDMCQGKCTIKSCC